jgi:RNA polymerase sigma-70 factor (family 1)
VARNDERSVVISAFSICELFSISNLWIRSAEISTLAAKERIIDHNFLLALRQGDGRAFKTLVDMYQQKVFNTAMGLVQDSGIAEDITQEVFVTVFRSLLSFNEKSALSTWIYRITVNKCMDHLRYKNRQKRQGIFSSLFHRDTGEVVYDIPMFVHPGVQLERKETARYLFEAIATLPDNQKIAFTLAHVEELSQKEVAEVMDLSVKAVESLLQRAKNNLRKKLGGIYDRRNVVKQTSKLSDDEK